jgi:palmitoyltransferase
VDPSRLPNPPPPPPDASAFVYGGDSFNPALRPSNAAKRRQATAAADEGDGWVTSSSRGSSPEPYLSDYDDEGWGPRSGQEEQEEQLRRLEGRVRRGSEGWEVRPESAWNRPQEGGMGPGPAWLEQGRYNVYEPSHDSGGE